MLRMLLQTLTYILTCLSLGMSGLLYYRIRSAAGSLLWPLKALAGSLAVLLLAGGVLAVWLGLLLPAPLAAPTGAAGALLAGVYVWRVTRCRIAFKVSVPGRAERPASPSPRKSAPPRWERDVVFWSVPGSDRALLCDLWQPPEGVPPSGLALIYLHSSSWHLADKDLWTRPFFRHLARQGHVVMDVAYRLCPEVDVHGMLADSKRAVAWMKAHAAQYGADPERTVLCGASAGGHLALLAAYTPGHPRLTPADLRGIDTTVRAVVSYYGLPDLRAFYELAGAVLPSARLLSRLLPAPLLAAATWLARRVPGHPFAGQIPRLTNLSRTGIMANLLGGQPDELPALCDLASPITHAGAHCPPTLLIQGAHDVGVPLAAACALEQRLLACGVPAASLVLPQTDHLFDLVLPQVSPAARVALRHLDRFLALV